MNETLKVCFDRYLPRALARPQHTTHTGPGAARAVLHFRKMWVNGSRLSVRFLGGTPAQQAKAKEQALWWTPHANLTFDFNNSPRAEIRIAFDANDGAWSYIGTDARDIPVGQPTMNLGFLDGGTAAHEFGHAIGLGHEHQNPQGGIQWNEEVVIRDLGGPPNSWTPEEARHNVIEKYRADQIRGTRFDPESIMLYFFPDTWVTSGKGTKENDVLSATDKSFIASAQGYPKKAVQAVELRLNAQPTQAAIGVPGEEDLFGFTVATAGRHLIETGGQTDVFMRLFGPNSQTSVLAEDDDGGVGTNSRIVADLIRGRYFVQIRHFNKARGTGSYSIRAAR